MIYSLQMVRRALAIAFAFASLLFVSAGRAQAEPIAALTTSNTIFSFDSATPGTISAPLAITGLQSQEAFVAVDRRPADGLLYGLTNQNRIYTINTLSGAATFVSAVPGGTGAGGSTGFDFNPAADRLRVSGNLLTGTTATNSRINVDTGQTLVDAPFAFASGDPFASVSPVLSGLAYTNNVAGVGSTSLYGIVNRVGASINAPLLVTVPVPNAGTFNTVGTLDIFNVEINGFDISGVTGTAYALGGGAQGPQLFTVNLTTGVASLIGNINTEGVLVRSLVGIAAGVGQQQQQPIPEPATILLLGTGLAGIGGLIRKRRQAQAK